MAANSSGFKASATEMYMLISSKHYHFSVNISSTFNTKSGAWMQYGPIEWEDCKECLSLSWRTDRQSQFEMASIWSKTLTWWQAALTSTGSIYSQRHRLGSLLNNQKKLMDFLVVEINYTIIFSIHPMHERGCQLFGSTTGLGQDFCPMIANLFHDD